MDNMVYISYVWTIWRIGTIRILTGSMFISLLSVNWSLYRRLVRSQSGCTLDGWKATSWYSSTWLFAWAHLRNKSMRYNSTLANRTEKKIIDRNISIVFLYNKVKREKKVYTLIKVFISSARFSWPSLILVLNISIFAISSIFFWHETHNFFEYGSFSLIWNNNIQNQWFDRINHPKETTSTLSCSFINFTTRASTVKTSSAFWE